MIFLFYTVTTAVIFALSLFPFTEQLGEFRGSLQSGYLYIGACYVSFSASYLFKKLATESASRKRYRPETLSHRSHRRVSMNVRTKYILLLAIWSSIGAIVAVLQVQTSIGFSSYMSLLARGGHSAEIARTSAIMVDSSAGGLPGIVKLWNQNCTASVIILMFLLAAGHRIRGLTQITLTMVIGASFLVRNSLYMDRLALLALVPAVFYVWRTGNRTARKTIVIIALGIVALAEVQSLRRGNGFGAAHFFVLYVQSGLINANLMVQTLTSPHTLGQYTILSPIHFLAKSVGSASRDAMVFSYVWTRAQDAYGLFFLDFGWYAPIFFLLFGPLAYKLDAARKPRNNPTASGKIRACIFLSYAALSTMFVPAFTGPDFWVTLATLLFAARLENRHVRFCFTKAKTRSRPGRSMQQYDWRPQVVAAVPPDLVGIHGELLPPQREIS